MLNLHIVIEVMLNFFPTRFLSWCDTTFVFGQFKRCPKHCQFYKNLYSLHPLFFLL